MNKIKLIIISAIYLLGMSVALAEDCDSFDFSVHNQRGKDIFIKYNTLEVPVEASHTPHIATFESGKDNSIQILDSDHHLLYEGTLRKENHVSIRDGMRPVSIVWVPGKITLLPISSMITIEKDTNGHCSFYAGSKKGDYTIAVN